MKFRAGFVSNSSSSSFIAYGFEAEKLPEDIKKKWLETYICNVRNINDDVVGLFLATWFDECYNFFEDNFADRFSPDRLKDIKTYIKKVFKETFDFDVPDDWFKIIAGSWEN